MKKKSNCPIEAQNYSTKQFLNNISVLTNKMLAKDCICLDIVLRDRVSTNIFVVNPTRVPSHWWHILEVVYPKSFAE